MTDKQPFWRIWPLLYFAADWPESIEPDFTLGVKIIKVPQPPGDDARDDVRDTNPRFVEELRENTDWLLAVPVEVPKGTDGDERLLAFLGRHVADSIAHNFLTCLKVIRSTPVQSSIKVDVPQEEFPPDLEVVLKEYQDFYGSHVQKPHVTGQGKFTLDDLSLLQDIWAAMVDLRGLKEWRAHVLGEGITQDLGDRAEKGVEERKRRLRRLLTDHPILLSLLRAELEEGGQLVLDDDSLLRQLMDDLDDDLRWACLKEEFTRDEEYAFRSRTRIGRALMLFDDGLRLPELHAFLSMCLVLETLFTVGEGEVLHKLASRAAKVLEKDLSKRKKVFRRTREIYRLRSKIVHGEKLLDPREPLLKDALELVRRSLQCIMLDRSIRSLYADPITSDKKEDKKRQTGKVTGSVRDFLEDLDLGA